MHLPSCMYLLTFHVCCASDTAHQYTLSFVHWRHVLASQDRCLPPAAHVLGKVSRLLAGYNTFPVPNVLACFRCHALMVSMVCRLSDPTATLSGIDQNGTSHSILLTLSVPKAEPASKVCLVWSTVIKASIPLCLRCGIATVIFPCIILGGGASALFKMDAQLWALHQDVRVQPQSGLQSLQSQYYTTIKRRVLGQCRRHHG